MNKLKNRINSIPIILITISLVIILSIVLYIYANKWSENKPITGISLKNNKYVNKNEVVEKIEPYVKSKTKKEINLDSVSNLVKKIKYVLSAKSTFGLNGELIIDITERSPMAIIIDENGNLTAIDKEITEFDKFFKTEYKLPVIFVNKNYVDKRKISYLVNYFSNYENYANEIYNLFFEFYLTNDKRIFRAKERLYNLDVLLSTEMDLKTQFEKYLDLIKNIELVNINNINYLDLRWKSKVIINYKNLI